MKICFSLLSILFTWVTASALSLGPYTERIIVKGDTMQLVISNKYDPICMLDTARLDAIDKAYLEVTNGMIILVEDTPRVYACSWEIRNNALFLVRITTHGHNRMGRETIPLDRVFDKRSADGKVFANWFSGTLFIGKGEFNVLEYCYDELLCISVHNGMIRTTKVYKGSQKGDLLDIMYPDASKQSVHPAKTTW